MSKLLDHYDPGSNDVRLHRIENACRRIAPSWPLDQAIAVNPYVGFLDMSMREAASLLHFVSGSQMLMPAPWYGINEPNPSTMRVMRCYSDLIDQRRTSKTMTCRDVITNTTSQHCAAYFDRQQAQWQAPRGLSLYASWRNNLSRDPGPSLLTGISKIAMSIGTLPESAEAMILQALEILEIAVQDSEIYALCLLYRINGWASWCAYLDLPNDGYSHRKELLAICLGFEVALSRCVAEPELVVAWFHERQSWQDFQRKPCADRRWVLQEGLESAYHAEVHQLLDKPSVSYVGDRPQVQAIFCIDVRSEVYRRALEASSSSIATLGTAGFFGLPIAYRPVGSDIPRSQVVQLLTPCVTVEESAGSNEADTAISHRRRIDLSLRHLFSEWKRSAVAKFTFVESFGILFAFALFAKARNAHSEVRTDYVGIRSREVLRPRIISADDAQQILLAQSLLRGMSLVKDFVPIICIIGHESDTSNNPQASALECGACGGQSGAINAQVAAELLNRPSVRLGLREHGIEIPDTTWFCAGVHHTSNDEVTLYDHAVPEAHRVQLAALRSSLSSAGRVARRERGSERAVSARHWANVQPEWGLARNAAIIIAPRSRTLQKVLDGRVFLQDYDHVLDGDGSVLRGILSGPLIVAHWISLQYYASTVDPDRFGSGNKLLHNVVGGSIGVFEGNGGDLRIGISRQALYDGTHLVHTPLRLAAWIEAPRDRCVEAIRSQEMVCRMIAGGWMTLFHIDPNDDSICRAEMSITEYGAYDLRWHPALLSRNEVD